MNKIIEGIKDIVHDSIDVILVIVILLAVGGTILWRLDILFATDMDNPAINQPIDNDVATEDETIDSPSDSDDDSSPDSDDSSSEQNQNNSNNDTGSENNDSEDSSNPNEETDENNEPIIVVIPSGSLAPDVRDIVYNLGLIKSDEYWTFLSRAQELGLDTKFQSGTFKIERDASLDTIIKTIARAL